MKEENRRAIAFAAAARINGRSGSSVYSYSSKRHIPMTESYDYASRSFISQTSGGLYHYGTKSHISFTVNGRNFSGYDYGSGHHFSGSVSGSSVQLYDYGERKYFNYST